MVHTLKTLLANRRQRMHPFFVIGIPLGVILLLGGVLLGLRIVLPAHANAPQTTADSYQCSSDGHPAGGAWTSVSGSGSYTGPRGAAKNGTFLNPNDHCSGKFSEGWDQQLHVWTWSLVVPHWPTGTLCTALVWIPSWYAGATNARYTLDNGSLGKSITATLNQEPIVSVQANTGFVNPWVKANSPAASGIPAGNGKDNVTLTLTLRNSGSPKYLAADAIDFHCTGPLKSISTPTPTPTSASGSTPPSGQGNQTVSIMFNGHPVQLDNNGQATLAMNGHQSATLTLHGTDLTLTDGQSTITTTIGSNSTSQSMINGQTISITVHGKNVTISTATDVSTN